MTQQRLVVWPLRVRVCTLWAVWSWCVSTVIGVYVYMRTCGHAEEGRQTTRVGLEMFAFFRLVTANGKPPFAPFPRMWQPAGTWHQSAVFCAVAARLLALNLPLCHSSESWQVRSSVSRWTCGRDDAGRCRKQHPVSPRKDTWLLSFSQCDCTGFFHGGVNVNLISINALK